MWVLVITDSITSAHNLFQAEIRKHVHPNFLSEICEFLQPCVKSEYIAKACECYEILSYIVRTTGT